METKHLLSLFNLRDIEITIFEKLFSKEGLSAGELAKIVDISRPAVYDLADKLIQKGLVYQTIKSGVKIFATQHPAKIKQLLNEKQEGVYQAKKELEEIENVYFEHRKNINPRLQLFEGKKALQQMTKDMLLYNDMTVFAYWPAVEMVKFLSSEFLREFHERRIKNNIHLKVIWPQKQISTTKKYPFLEVGEKFKREVRLAPANANFSLGYSLYKNTVRFASSEKENFGFMIESHELAEMMKSQFEILWKASKPLTLN